jgi:murein DD-endopeptidase MepM/ murein hydrolase activator NlpD
MNRWCRISALEMALSAVVWANPVQAQSGQMFSAPGELVPGSGTGVKNQPVYYPDMRFPVEHAPAFANSQVYAPGGMHGGPGGQGSPVNYSYPWHDTYCESRSWKMPICPSGNGHQGQDIRPALPKAKFYWAVAVADGIISSIGSYSVTLQTPGGTLFRYLHLDGGTLAVHPLERVSKGQKIGLISNNFGDSRTTIHLHFDISDTIALNGKTVRTFLPPYASLVNSYKKLLAP